MKKLLTTILAFIMLLTVTPTALSAQPQTPNNIRITVNGTELNLTDTQPFRNGEHIMLPAQPVFEALGFSYNPIQGNHGLMHRFQSLAFAVTVPELNPGVNVRTLHITIQAHALYARSKGNVHVFIPQSQNPQIINGTLFISLQNFEELFERWADAELRVNNNTNGLHITMQSGFVPELDYSTASIRHYMDGGYTLEEAVFLWEKSFLDEVNRVRAEHGILPLRHDDRLHAAARDHSEDMLNNRLTGHRGSDGSSEFDRARRRGWEHGVRENVWNGTSILASPQRAVQLFYDSPGHRATMLLIGLYPEQQMYTGVGVYVKGNVMFVTHKLGRLPTN